MCEQREPVHLAQQRARLDHSRREALRRARLAVVVAALLGATIGLAGCGSDADRRPTPDVKLRPVRVFQPFTLYYAGRSYGELPLTIDGGDDARDHHRGEPVSFTYGGCEPPPEAQEDRCSEPLAISNYEICAENPSRYPRGDYRMTRLRGVPAALFGQSGDSLEKLELYTGTTTVVIEIDGVRAAYDVARHLIPLNRRPSGDRLPPPARGALRTHGCAAGGP